MSKKWFYTCVACRPNAFFKTHKDCEGVILMSLDGKRKIMCACKCKKEPTNEQK